MDQDDISDRYYNNILCDVTVIENDPLISELIPDSIKRSGAAKIACAGSILHQLTVYLRTDRFSEFYYVLKSGEIIVKLFDSENKPVFNSAVKKMLCLDGEELMGDSQTAKGYRKILKKLICV